MRQVVSVKLPSKNLVYLDGNILANEGKILSRPKRKLSKAGQIYDFCMRPRVRGVAKNPIDHPHGGGEGKTSGGRPSVTPWGFCTKGMKTTKSWVYKRSEKFLKKLRKRNVQHAKKYRPVVLF